MSPSTRRASLVLLTLALLASLALTAQAQPRPLAAQGLSDDARLIDQLRQETAGKVQIARHDKTGKVRFIGTTPDRTIKPGAQLAAQATPEQAARAFLDSYGALFGSGDPARELRVARTLATDSGRTFVRFQQVYRDVPILGGELNVQVDAANAVLSANGELQPELAIGVKPAISAAQAQQQALAAIAKQHRLPTNALTASAPELWIYNAALLGGPGLHRPALVWRLEVTPRGLEPIRELVLIDAQRGMVALRFNQIAAGRARYVCDRNNVIGASETCSLAEAVRSEGGPATGIVDVDRAYEYAGATYDYFQNTLGRDSIDGAGLRIISTVRYCPNAANCPYKNAFWNGEQMVYGAGYAAADDVVAHELAHGVTQYTSGLFYYYQSGAINEALSDIFGEFVDLSYDGPNDNDTAGVRWLVGEDLPDGGAIRDMENPPVSPIAGGRGSPDKMTSALYWADPQELDNGAVHFNSGVANKAAFLMTDGGTFNGQTITGLGTTKASRIWYEVAAHMLLSASDYQDLYNALQQACTNLIGTAGITAGDCQQVLKVVTATEMNINPPAALTTEAPYCAPGQRRTSAFNDNLETPASGNWTSAAATGVNAWYYPQNSNPFEFDATYATSGRYNLWGYNVGGFNSSPTPLSDYSIRMTRAVRVPAGGYLHFSHAYGFENDSGGNYDGSIVEYSTNGGASWSDAGPLFVNGGYNGTISNAFSNPLGGRQAFVAQSNGYGSSRVNLASLAGQNVLIRFRIGVDQTFDDYGWFIDDVQIYSCYAPPAGMSERGFLPTLSR